MMTKERAYFEKVKKALVDKMNKGLDTDLEGEPILRLKNGIVLIIRPTIARKSYIVEQSYGLTYKELAWDVPLDRVVEIIIEKGGK